MRQTAALVLVTVLALSPAAAAQGMPDADQRELQSYRLTMPKLKQLTQVYASIARTLEQDPTLQQMGKLKAEYDALQEKDELTEADERRLEALEAQMERLDEKLDQGPAGAMNMSNARTIGEMASRIDAHPPLASAVKSAGFTSREFATLQLALVQAMFAHGFMKAGTLKELPRDVNPENVKFLQEHEAEIQALAKEWQAAGIGEQP